MLAINVSYSHQKKSEFCQQKPLQGPQGPQGPHLFPGTLHLLRLEERRLADGGAKRVTFQEPRRLDVDGNTFNTHIRNRVWLVNILLIMVNIWMKHGGTLW